MDAKIEPFHRGWPTGPPGLHPYDPGPPWAPRLPNPGLPVQWGRGELSVPGGKIGPSLSRAGKPGAQGYPGVQDNGCVWAPLPPIKWFDSEIHNRHCPKYDDVLSRPLNDAASMRRHEITWLLAGRT